MNIIDGKEAALDIRHQLRKDILANNLTPNLATILVGTDKASHKYVNLKRRAAEEIGIAFHLYTFSNKVTQKEIEETIDFLNTDTEIDGILIQLPLPKHLDTDLLVNKINPKKDADGFGNINLKKYLEKSPDGFVPGLVESIDTLIKKTKIEVGGKHAYILANSPTFSLAMSQILEQQKITVTTLLKPTPKDLEQLKQADIIIVILGKKLLIEAGHTKNNVIIIDAGYNKDADSTCGDVNAQSFQDTDVWITPVPGGVGPMTVAMLLKRVVKLYIKNHEKN